VCVHLCLCCGCGCEPLSCVHRIIFAVNHCIKGRGHTLILNWGTNLLNLLFIGYSWVFMWVFHEYSEENFGGIRSSLLKKWEGIRVWRRYSVLVYFLIYFLKMFGYFFEYCFRILWWDTLWDTLEYFGILWNSLRNTYEKNGIPKGIYLGLTLTTYSNTLWIPRNTHGIPSNTRVFEVSH